MDTLYSRSFAILDQGQDHLAKEQQLPYFLFFFFHVQKILRTKKKEDNAGGFAKNNGTSEGSARNLKKQVSAIRQLANGPLYGTGDRRQKIRGQPLECKFGG